MAAQTAASDVKALPAPQRGPDSPEGVLDGLWKVLDSVEDNLVKAPRVLALTLQCILAIWEVRHLSPSPSLPAVFPVEDGRDAKNLPTENRARILGFTVQCSTIKLSGVFLILDLECPAMDTDLCRTGIFY